MASVQCNYCGRPDHEPGARRCVSCGHDLPVFVADAPSSPPPRPDRDSSFERTVERREIMAREAAEAQRRTMFVSFGVAGAVLVAITVTALVEHEHEVTKKKAAESDHHSELGQTTVQNVQPSPPARDPNVVELGWIQVTWTGKILESTGAAPPVGSTCTLATHVKTTDSTHVSQDQLTVFCGGKNYYDENAKLAGSMAWDYVLTEKAVPKAVSVYAYRLRASDVGVRTGARNQLTVSTKDHELVVFRDTAPTFRMKIAVDMNSAPRTGKPIFEYNAPPFNVVVKAKATLTASTGALPFTGKTCELTLSPGDATYSCQVRLECGPALVYGAGTAGWDKCAIEGGLPVSFSDTTPSTKDNDPELTVDMNAHTAALADELANGTKYSATFTLVPEAP